MVLPVPPKTKQTLGAWYFRKLSLHCTRTPCALPRFPRPKTRCVCACDPALGKPGHVEAQRRGPGLRNLRGCGSALYAIVCLVNLTIRAAGITLSRPLAGLAAHISIMTTEFKVLPTFDALGLKEDLLRGEGKGKAGLVWTLMRDCMGLYPLCGTTLDSILRSIESIFQFHPCLQPQRRSRAQHLLQTLAEQYHQDGMQQVIFTSMSRCCCLRAPGVYAYGPTLRFHVSLSFHRRYCFHEERGDMQKHEDLRVWNV